MYPFNRANEADGRLTEERLRKIGFQTIEKQKAKELNKRHVGGSPLAPPGRTSSPRQQSVEKDSAGLEKPNAPAPSITIEVTGIEDKSPRDGVSSPAKFRTRAIENGKCWQDEKKTASSLTINFTDSEVRLRPRPKSFAGAALARRDSFRHSDARIVVMGTRNVGKSALTVRFLTKRFIGEYDSSKDSTYTHQTTIDDEQVNLEILDSGPPPEALEAASRILESRAIWGDSFFLVYSTTSRRSFNKIRPLHQAISTLKPRPAIIIVGNKSDLKHCRRVKKCEGELLAAELKCPFYECSAAESYESVLECFHELYREVARKKKEKKLCLSPKPLRNALGKVFRRNSIKGILLNPNM